MIAPMKGIVSLPGKRQHLKQIVTRADICVCSTVIVTRRKSCTRHGQLNTREEGRKLYQIAQQVGQTLRQPHLSPELKTMFTQLAEIRPETAKTIIIAINVAVSKVEVVCVQSSNGNS